MKGTEHFKDVIQNYLETRASYDELFAESFRKENKSIDECWKIQCKMPPKTKRFYPLVPK